MGKIIVTENVSLDGVVQDPTGEEGFDRGGWAGQLTSRDRQEWGQFLFEEALAAEALLLGRRSDAWFAERWLARTGAWADRLNSMPKYVVSATVAEPRWTNSTIIKGDVPSEVSQLKDNLAGNVVVYASRHLVAALLEHDLIDELRLIVYPVVAGAGERLLGETSEAKPVRLTSTRALGDSLALLTYQPVRLA
ncbi:MAG: dihydrofolate reductase family protein [Streptosporangiaceae bacterium]